MKKDSCGFRRESLALSSQISFAWEIEFCSFVSLEFREQNEDVSVLFSEHIVLAFHMKKQLKLKIKLKNK